MCQNWFLKTSVLGHLNADFQRLGNKKPLENRPFKIFVIWHLKTEVVEMFFLKTH